MKLTLLNSIRHVTTTAACLVYLTACESEYPQRKKIEPDKTPTIDTSEKIDSDKGTNDDIILGTDTGKKTGTETPTESGTNTDSETKTETSATTSTKTSTATSTSTSTKTDTNTSVTTSKQLYVCKNTALISLEDGRTNCFLQVGTIIKTESMKITGDSFAVVVLPEKISGCTMLTGQLFLSHVSSSAACDTYLGNK